MPDSPTAPENATDRPTWRRRLGRFLVRAAAVYLGVIVLLLFLENALLYHPYRHTDSWEPPPPNLVMEDVWLQSADGTRIHGWWFPHPDARGALLYCHGNAGNLSHRGHVVPDIMKTLGVSVMLFDYPGYGKSDGSPSEAGCYAAGAAAYDWLTQTKQVPPEQVILFGKSLGGGIATQLATDPATPRPHRALVLVKSFTSVPDMAQRQFPFLPARWLVRNRFDNLAKIGQCARPVVIAQGDRDELIPHWMAEQLYAAAPEPKRLFLLANSHHNDPFPPAFLPDLADFLRSTAPQPSGGGAN